MKAKEKKESSLDSNLIKLFVSLKIRFITRGNFKIKIQFAKQFLIVGYNFMIILNSHIQLYLYTHEKKWTKMKTIMKYCREKTVEMKVKTE